MKLQSVLEEGEQLLWSGRPEPIGTLQGLYKSAILRKILMIAAGIVILAGWYISAAVKNGVEVQPGEKVLLGFQYCFPGKLQ